LKKSKNKRLAGQISKILVLPLSFSFHVNFITAAASSFFILDTQQSMKTELIIPLQTTKQQVSTKTTSCLSSKNPISFIKF